MRFIVAFLIGFVSAYFFYLAKTIYAKIAIVILAAFIIAVAHSATL